MALWVVYRSPDHLLSLKVLVLYGAMLSHCMREQRLSTSQCCRSEGHLVTAPALSIGPQVIFTVFILLWLWLIPVPVPILLLQLLF